MKNKPFSYFLPIIFYFICITQNTSAQDINLVRLQSKQNLISLTPAELRQMQQTIDSEYVSSAYDIDNIQTGGIIQNYIYSIINRFIITAIIKNENVAFTQLMQEHQRIVQASEKLHTFYQGSQSANYNFICQALNHQGYSYYSINFLENTLLTDKNVDSLDAMFVQTLFNYACENENLGNSCKDIEYLIRAELLAVHIKDDADRDLCLNTLATVYRNLGEFRKSKETYETLFEKMPKSNTLEYGHSLQAYSHLLGDMGDFDDAEKFMLESYSIISKIAPPNSYHYAAVTGGLLKAYLQSEKYQEAERIFINNESIFKIGFADNPSQYAIFLGNASKLYLALGNMNRSTELTNQLIKIVTSLPDNEKNEQLAGVWNHIGQYYSRSDNKSDLGKASAAFEKAVSLSRIYLGGNKILYAEYLSNAFEFNWKYESIGNKEISWLIEANRIFNKYYSENIFGFDEFSVRKFKKYFSRNNDVLMSLCIDRPGDSLILNALNNQLVFKNSLLRSSRRSTKSMDFESIRKSLKTNDALVNFVQFKYLKEGEYSGEKLYAAFIIYYSQKTPKFIPLFEEKELSALITKNGELKNPEQIYLSANNFKEGDFYRNGNNLSHLIWTKISPRIPRIVNTIYYLPDGLLSFVCLPALVDEKGFLADRFEFRTLLDASSLITDDQNSIFHSAAIFGGIAYYLPNHLEKQNSPDDFEEDQVKQETLETVKNIAEIIEAHNGLVELNTDDKATEETFNNLQKKNPDAIIFSTHGFSHSYDSVSTQRSFIYTSPNGMDRCGIALANANEGLRRKATSSDEDGLLTGNEISKVNLSSTKLVVLGGCKTGVGEIEIGEGVWGLQRAFKIAGVQYILVSTCTVGTEYTSEFLASFFSELYDKKNSDVEMAFSTSQKIFKNKYPNSVDWTNWLLVK